MGVECFLLEYTGQMRYFAEDETDLGVYDPPDQPEEWRSGSPEMRRVDTGEAVGHPLPPGAIFDYMDPKCPHESFGDGYKDRAVNGQFLVCVLPGGHHWHIDGRAGNCTMPDDDEHRCWVRHGEPPKLTVDKDGNTCAAGAGSIAIPGWHGFMRDGTLVT